MSATSARDHVITKAKSDPSAAYKLAKAIDDPWYRGQALAWVAWSSPDDCFDAVVKEAVGACVAAADPYQTVGAAAWPIRAMVERGRHTQAQRAVCEILLLASQIENPVNRADALFLLFQAVFPVDELRWDVLARLISACREMESWKGPRLMRDVVSMLAGKNRGEAEHVLSEMPEGRAKRQAERSFLETSSFHPREFFWVE